MTLAVRCAALALGLCTGAFAQSDPLPLRAVRSLPSAAKRNDVIAVAIALRIPSGTAGTIRISEKPPEGWVVLESHPPAQWDEELLTWSLKNTPDSTQLLSYSMRLPADTHGVGVFHGEGIAQSTGETFTTDGAEIVPIGSSINVAGFDLNTWEIIGIIGTIVFMGRFLIQWIVSERRGKSVVPIAFWWLSIVGSAILLAYGVHFRRFAIVLGQAFGFIVYIRNLQLIRQRRRGKPAADANAAEPV